MIEKNKSSKTKYGVHVPIEEEIKTTHFPKISGENDFNEFCTKIKHCVESVPSFNDDSFKIIDLKSEASSNLKLNPSNPSIINSISNPKNNKTKKSNFYEGLNFNKNEKEKPKNLYDVITTFYLAKKFVGLLHQISFFRKPKFMNETHFELIGDQSFYYPIYQHQLELENIKNNTKQNFQSLSMLKRMVTIKNTIMSGKMFSNYPNFIQTFHPYHIISLIFDLLNILIFMLFFAIIPINLSFKMNIFQEEISEDAQYALKTLIIIFYVIDILYTCNTSYYEKGELIIQRKEIMKKYFKKLFWFDVLCGATLICTVFNEINFFYNGLSRIFAFVYFLKFSKIAKIFVKIEELLVVDQFYFNVLSLITLISRLIVVTHVAACIWHYLAFHFEGNENMITWLTTKELISEIWYIRYLYSFYYILITMNTVGYGDISPTNPWETLFCVCFVFVACLMFGYCINCVGTIFQDIYKRESEFKKDLFIINDFMRTKNIPKELQMRIRKYLEHIWKEEKIHSLEQAENVLNKLSESLKFELILEVNGPIIKNIDILSQKFSEKTLRETIKIMKEERYTPGDVIFYQGAYDNKDLFLVKKGKVEIFVENELNEKEVKVLKELKEGQIFGEIAFFSDGERTASARAKEFTTLIRIDQNLFKNILNDSDLDREKYNSIKDSIKLYNNYKDIMLTCYACNGPNHLISNCPLLHKNIFKDLCIRKHNYSTSQERETFQRQKKKERKRKIDKPYQAKQSLTYSLPQDETDENEDLDDSSEMSSLMLDKNTEKINKADTLEDIPFLKEDEELQSSYTNLKSSSNNKISSLFGKEDVNQQGGDNISPKEDISITSLKSPAMYGNAKKSTILKNEERKKRKNTVHFAEETGSNMEKSQFSVKSSHELKEIHKKNETNAKDNDNPDAKNVLYELEFDKVKSFEKYFVGNNVAHIVDEANRRTYRLLKKKKKAHLFEKAWINKEIAGITGPSLKKQVTKLKDGSPKKNILRKASMKSDNWKDALEYVQKQKQEMDQRKKSSGFAKTISSFFRNMLEKK